MLPGLLLLLLQLLVASAATTTTTTTTSCPEDSEAVDEAGGGCKCLPKWACPKHECPDEMKRVRVRDAVPDTPGRCCPLYECQNPATLTYDQEEGQHQCTDGQGQPRELGEHWLESDPCTNCTCEAGGRPYCYTTMCRSCTYPRQRDPNECCPKCLDSPQLCPSLDRECATQCGDLGLERDRHGCPVCRCRKAMSPPRSQCPARSDCALDCEHGLVRDADDCEVCQCRPHLDCPPRLLCETSCPMGYKTNQTTGCPTCQCSIGCIDENEVSRYEGERWSHDPCRSCVCLPTGAIQCNQTVCSLGCTSPAPAPPGQCCPVCQPPKQETEDSSRNGTGGGNGWGTIPIVLIVVLGLLCIVLMVHLVRSRFRARLDASREADLYQQQQQYYKCVPVYEPVLRHAEKIVAL